MEFSSLKDLKKPIPANLNHLAKYGLLVVFAIIALQLTGGWIMDFTRGQSDDKPNAVTESSPTPKASKSPEEPSR